MRKLSAYCLAGATVVLATCAIAAIMLVPPVSAGPVTRSGAAVQWVDRGGKGDRLDLNSSIVRKHQLQQVPHKIMSGCEPVFSPLVASARANNFAGRCTA